jgi:hypothetical protein
MFGLFVFLISLQTEVNVSNHLSREDCQVAAEAIQKSQDVKSVRCEFFKPKSVEEGF